MRSSFYLLFFTSLTWLVRAEEPNSKTLGRCPNGHDTLRDVPIVYGIPPQKGAALARWKKAIARYEFASTGCHLGGSDPSIQVTCMTCGFAHTLLLTDMPETGSWSRDSADPKSFKQPFAPFITGFPKPPPKLRRGSFDYLQNFDDALKLRFESLSYTTREPATDIRSTIDDWLKKQGLVTTYNEKTITIIDGSKRDIRDWHGKGFSILMHTEHSDRSSWISAYFDGPK